MLPTILAVALSAAPISADTVPRWTHVSVGHDHACALDSAGQAFCWGSNYAGQLGATTGQKCGIVGESGHRSCYPTASDTPVAAGGAMRFAAISAGRSRTCALDASGRAFCWGDDLPGSASKCLNGTRCSFVPLPFEPAHRFRTFATGSRATCGVTVDGQALCTAILSGNRWWELTAMRPVRAAARARDVDAWADWPTQNVCMVDGRGAAWCRGSNRTAQLGTGAPPSVAGEEVDSLTRVAGRMDFRRVVAQDGWMCGLSTAGQAFCWGMRSTKVYYTRDGTPPGGCRQYACATAPVPVGGALRFRDISGHHQQVCGLTARGEAYCWAPTRGELSSTDPWADYTPVRLQPDLRFSALAGNVEFGSGSCGITIAGALYCWGRVNEPPELVRIVHPGAAR